VLTRHPSDPGQQISASVREVHRVEPAIGGVAPPLDEPTTFQAVDQRY
jgi:hypothetical protein